MTRMRGEPTVQVRAHNIRENWIEGLLRHELGEKNKTILFLFLFLHMAVPSMPDEYLLQARTTCEAATTNSSHGVTGRSDRRWGSGHATLPKRA